MAIFAVLAVMVGLFIAGLAVFGAVLHAILWLVLLPFRLVFSLLALPLLLVKFVLASFGAVLALVMLAIAVAIALAAGIVLALPLFPIACLLFVAWAVSRSRQPIRS